MSEKHDVIIIGAGIGGLTAAAYLVRAGLQVLVLEKSPHPGGTAYVYYRKGFTFPMGPLGFSTLGLVKKMLAELDQPVTEVFHRVHYAVHAFGHEIVLSQPLDLLSEDLKRRFPDDGKGIDRFFHDLGHTLAAMQSPQDPASRTLLKEMTTTSAKNYLASFIMDWRLRRFLGSLGTYEPYSSIPLMAAMWNLMSDEGIWYPSNGMRSLSDRLARAVTTCPKDSRAKGEIRLGVCVKEIVVEKGTVTGVILDDGMFIGARIIISNTDFKTTYLKLLSPEILPDALRKAVAEARQTGSVLQVCLGVHTDAVDLSAFSAASRLLYRKQGDQPGPPSEAVDWNASQIDDRALASQELELALMTREYRELAPPEKSVIVIRTEADHSHFSRFRSPEKRRIALYRDYKMRLARTLVRTAEHVIPGLEKAVEVIDVATPLTFEDQGGRSQGSVAGWSWDYEDSADYAPLELTLTPIRSLYTAGYQAYSTLFMGGVPTAMESGRKAAEAVLQSAPPAEEVRIPGVH